MNLPMIDFSSLPDLNTLTGMFGSLLDLGKLGGNDDTGLDIMEVIYNVIATSHP